MCSSQLTHEVYTRHSIVSIGVNGPILVCMMRTLAQYVTDRRQALGMNQTELATRAGVERTLINRIESGTTKLPSPDKRRRIATGLGVSHLELLVAAGELTEEEARFRHGGGHMIDGNVEEHLLPLIQVIDWSDELALLGMKKELDFWKRKQVNEGRGT